MRPTIVILTYNCATTLAPTLERARLLSDEIFAVDSFSTDDTVRIAKELGANVVQHEFIHYGAQRNWAIDNLPITRPWQLHLDADEIMSPELVAEILALPDEPAPSGYFLARYLRFLGRVLRHGGMNPTWHLRLFRTGVGRCEDRKYDQHYYLLNGQTARLRNSMIDDIRLSLSEWTTRHNRWADGEVAELLSGESGGRITASATGNAAEQKRYLRSLYDRAPALLRPFVLFHYRYFFRLGFLDGVEGFIFYVLQTFWFRFLIDAKLWEARKTRNSK
jgi:glycosyltransferase involved in cell wall biosynthesis